MDLKVKIIEINADNLKSLKEINLRRLKDLKSKGYTKERLYKIFSKSFVDDNF